MPRISQLFTLFSGRSQQSVVSTSNSRAAASPEKPDVFVERRKIPDRRIAERRKVNCHPYLDTRSNNGRRRSFGRRATDEQVGPLS
ncbi:MAG: hypothetical protein E6Q34_10685 [Burkholderiaceae bacterium]|nr:MAG: hypothetical protein E6Q34_10685 [Burkholderiaceae bacterium]